MSSSPNSSTEFKVFGPGSLPLSEEVKKSHSCTTMTSSSEEEVPMGSPIESLSSVSMSPGKNERPVTQVELGARVTSQPKSLGSESFEATSPESGTSVEPANLRIGDLDITESFKPKASEEGSTAAASSTRSDSPSSHNSSGMTHLEFSDAKQRMKDNIAFIHEKTKELDRVTQVIQEKTEANQRLSEELIGLLDLQLEEANVGDAEKKNEELNKEIEKMRHEWNELREVFKDAWENIEGFRGKLEKLGT